MTGSIPLQRFTYLQGLLANMDSDDMGLVVSQNAACTTSRPGVKSAERRVERRVSLEDSPKRSKTPIRGTTQTRSLGSSASPRARSDITFLQEVANAEFETISSQGNGQVSLVEFKTWMLRLLGKGEIAARRQLVEKVKAKLQRALMRAESLFALEAATTVNALKEALVKAAPLLSKHEIGLYRTRLAEMRRPFTIHLSTLAGDALDLNVSRSDLVGSIREAVAKHFGIEADRVTLATEAGCLKPDSAPLDGFIRPDVPVTIAFEEAEEHPMAGLQRLGNLLTLFTQDVQRTTAELHTACRKSELVRADIVHLLAS